MLVGYMLEYGMLCVLYGDFLLYIDFGCVLCVLVFCDMLKWKCEI